VLQALREFNKDPMIAAALGELLLAVLIPRARGDFLLSLPPPPPPPPQFSKNPCMRQVNTEPLEKLLESATRITHDLNTLTEVCARARGSTARRSNNSAAASAAGE
jgi:hypothetical protein